MLSTKRNQDFTIAIRAEDKGMPPKSATVPVHLSITAENSYTPVFQPASRVYNVQEDAPIGQSVARVTATDQVSLISEAHPLEVKLPLGK